MSASQAVGSSVEVVYIQKRNFNAVSSVYHVDFWREVRKRWMVVGVLCAVALAVLSPRAGAAGGALRSQYTAYVPLTYIYYSAGRRSCTRSLLASVRERSRTLALCCAHAHLVAPALCAVVVTAFRDGVDYRIVKGAMMSSVCGGCVWLSLALCDGVAVAACACSGLISLLLAPLLCGLASMPSLSTLLLDVVTALTPFVVGLYRPAATPRHDATATKLSALSLVYVECCERLCDAAGILHVGDVLVTLLLVVCWVSLCALACGASARVAALPRADARLLLACALPKSLHYWQNSATCCLTGLARLPAALLAPAQALALAAAVPGDQRDLEDSPAGGTSQ